MNKRNTFQSVNMYPSARLVMFSNRVFRGIKIMDLFSKLIQYNKLYVYSLYTLHVRVFEIRKF